MYLSLLTFFGLTPEYRLNLFGQIHEIVFYGRGGYDWETVYNLPIWLRRFTFETILKHYEKEAEAAEGKKELTKSTNKKLEMPPAVQKAVDMAKTTAKPITIKAPKK